MNVVDLVIGVVVVAAAVHGLRLGALIQILTFGGFIVGMTLGALITDAALGSVRNGTMRDVLALGVTIGFGVLLGGAGRVLGSWSHVAIRRRHLGPIDSALGVVVAMVAVLLSVWLVASVLSESRFTTLNATLQQSDILRAVEGAMPPVPDVFSRVQGILGGGFPPVFQNFAPALAPSVPVLGVMKAESIGAHSAPSMVKVLGSACGYLQEGSGFIVAPHLIVTNAHVIAGEGSTTVTVGATTVPATPVLFDPNFDLAILRTSAVLGPSLTLDPTAVTRDEKGAVLGFPEDGPLSVSPAGVAANLKAEGRNIYNVGSVVRQVFQIDADVQPGNSGGPLIASDGRVIGVVFSRSTTSTGVGYALESPGVVARLATVDGVGIHPKAVSTGGCVTG